MKMRFFEIAAAIFCAALFASCDGIVNSFTTPLGKETLDGNSFSNYSANAIAQSLDQMGTDEKRAALSALDEKSADDLISMSPDEKNAVVVSVLEIALSQAIGGIVSADDFKKKCDAIEDKAKKTEGDFNKIQDLLCSELGVGDLRGTHSLAVLVSGGAFDGDDDDEDARKKQTVQRNISAMLVATEAASKMDEDEYKNFCDFVKYCNMANADKHGDGKFGTYMAEEKARAKQYLEGDDCYTPTDADLKKVIHIFKEDSTEVLDVFDDMTDIFS